MLSYTEKKTSKLNIKKHLTVLLEFDLNSLIPHKNVPIGMFQHSSSYIFKAKSLLTEHYEAVSLSFVINDSSSSCHSFFHNFTLIKMLVISINWFGLTIRARKHKQQSGCFFTSLKVKTRLIKSARLPRTKTESRTMHM
jgi:hypothetical protein